MNRSIRRVALGLALAFAALIANLHYVQVAKSTDYVEHPNNRRLLVQEYSIERGQIIVGRRVIAESVPTDDNLKYERRYRSPGLYGHITGYYSVVFGRGGLERTFNDFLTGKEPGTARDWIDDLLGREEKGNSLVLTLNSQLQALAAEKLGKQRGAVAAIDPKTGAVLALYANPSSEFNPNPLSSHDLEQVRETWEEYNADDSKPLIFRATQERYPPGSTFKIITAAAAMEFEKMTPSTGVPFDRRLDLPDSDRTLGNFGDSTCGGSLGQAFRQSCNTAFARFGMKVGADKLTEMATRFGLNQKPDFDLPAAASCIRAIPGGDCAGPPPSRPHTAYSAIGQFDVRLTALQMAVVAATVEQKGVRPRPFLVREAHDFAGRTVWEYEPKRTKPIYSKKTADNLRRLMIQTVESGTGSVVRIPGVAMGGKTGTAQTGVEGEPPHVWFAAFAPRIAVAVVVENGGDLRGDATGGRVAGPIAQALVKKVAGTDAGKDAGEDS